MSIHYEDTITAIATPIGEGGISVIRISGTRTFEIAEKIFQSLGKQKVADFESHTVHLGNILDAQGQILDQVLLTLFRSPNSYTGEDLIEISAHGGMVITRKILNEVLNQGVRHAEPGEFTKRAFLNGKIDLAQAEAVLDLIKAKSDRSAETAIRQLSGFLSRKFKSIKDELMKMYAHMEAFLDFPDEDLEIFSDQKFAAKFTEIQKELQKLIAGFSRGSLIREGASLVLVGKPNVGKSSLFNALLTRDRALVSEFPGTTRDVLEEAIEIQGWYLRLIDTAGLASEAGHPVEAMGMERTKQVMEQAVLFLYLVDGSSALDEKDEYAFCQIPSDKPVITVINKTDLGIHLNEKDLEKLSKTREWIKISTRVREGLDQLEKRIAQTLTKNLDHEESEQITRVRHKVALERALEALERSQVSFQNHTSLEIVIEDLKTALHEMKEIIGEVYSEDLLDVIFAEFCIGK